MIDKKSRHIGRMKPVNYTAVPKTEPVIVPHPRLEGHVEVAMRVVDTLSGMLKRRQLTERQYQAAEHYRTAFQTLYSTMGGSMDFERARGGSMPGSPPAPHTMIAGEIVGQVRAKLYTSNFAVVHRVCALGYSIAETTEQLYGKPTTRGQRDDCGLRLKAALDELADFWWPEHRGRGGNMRSEVMERAGVTDAETVPQGGVAHATGSKVYRSGRT